MPYGVTPSKENLMLTLLTPTKSAANSGAVDLEALYPNAERIDLYFVSTGDAVAGDEIDVQFDGGAGFADTGDVMSLATPDYSITTHPFDYRVIKGVTTGTVGVVYLVFGEGSTSDDTPPGQDPIDPDDPDNPYPPEPEVPVTPPYTPAQSSVYMAGYRNKVINGDLSVWQRGTSFTATGYGADRWLVAASANVPAIFKSTVNPGAIQGYDGLASMRVTVTADAVAGSYQIITQRIESARTLSGRKATLTFWTYCTTGKNIAVSLRQYYGSGGSPSDTYVYATCLNESNKETVGAAWKKHVFVFDVPSLSGETLGTDGNDRLELMFWFSCGSDYAKLTDTLGHQSGVFYLTGIQLEEGEISTPFECRPDSVELQLCHRYYWRTNLGQLNACGPIDNSIHSWRFGPAVAMRAIPTASSDFTGATYSYVDTLTWVASESTVSNGGLLYFYSNSATARANIYFKLAAANYIALSAEL